MCVMLIKALIYIYIDIEKNTFEVGPGVPCAAY